MKLKRTASVIVIISLILSLLVCSTPAFAAEKSPYRVEVDLKNQIVTVYTNDDESTVVLQCLCSSGADNATPTGTFKMPAKKRPTERTEWFHFRAYGGYARYATRIYKDVMFHSLLYSRPRESALNQKSVQDYGHAVSHGCIRLRVEDAKFIAENCPVGTVVKIRKGDERDEELRDLLYQSSYHASSGQSYNAFLGIPDEPGILGKNSSGDEVRDLQMKLKDLGIYTEDITGKYTLATVRAVREAQNLLGEKQTGMATLAFQQAIASPDAPSAMNVTLRQGSSGPAVRALQRNLQNLMLYEGGIDGVYDADVIDAVRTFQNAYGFEDDGVARPIVQKAVYYEGRHVQGLLGDRENCRMEIRRNSIYLGRVNCQVGIKLRKEPSTKSDSLMSLKNGATVIGLEYGPQWSRVMKNGATGYVMNNYMEYAAKETLSLTYLTADGAEICALGITDLNESPAEQFADYIAAGGSLETYEGMQEYARSDSALTMRGNPSETGDALGELPAGVDAEVLLKSRDWSLVAWNGMQGYVPNDALAFRLGAAEAGDEAEEEIVVDVLEDDTVEAASIHPMGGGSAAVYESGDEASAVLGKLKAGTAVNVIETVDGWSLIELKGHQGYVKEMDLRFSND